MSVNRVDWSHEVTKLHAEVTKLHAQIEGMRAVVTATAAVVTAAECLLKSARLHGGQHPPYMHCSLDCRDICSALEDSIDALNATLGNSIDALNVMEPKSNLNG